MGTLRSDSRMVRHMTLAERLAREPINLPGGRLVKVRYALIATKFRGVAK